MKLVPARRDQLELLDDPSRVLDDLSDNLADIRLLNRWFGGTAIALSQARPFLRPDRSVRVLDVATGSADIPLAIHRWSLERGINVSVCGLDLSEEVLSEARKVVHTKPIDLVRGDARSLPFAGKSFDLVLCCLALHHFAPDDAVRVLREMWRVTGTALVVTDLRRSYLGYAGTWLATRTVARNRLTRNDGPLSVLRAYTTAEMAGLARAAGLHGVSVRRHPFFRQVLVAYKGDRRE